ncbi:hypothetical protein [Streptomyces sp. NPDC058157]|uniref:hypothetical protein n=1 Tax=Streptomyces sp. NPDC058157 TaxID=3346360 RepID=UPI0036E161C2
MTCTDPLAGGAGAPGEAPAEAADDTGGEPPAPGGAPPEPDAEHPDASSAPHPASASPASTPRRRAPPAP